MLLLTVLVSAAFYRWSADPSAVVVQISGMGPTASELRTIPLFHGFGDDELAAIGKLFTPVAASDKPLFDVNE